MLKMKRMSGLLALAAAGLALSGGAAGAGERIANGGFETTTLPVTSEFGGLRPQQQVANWTTNGYNWVFRPGEADLFGGPGDFGNLKLWGPQNGIPNGLPATSPAGGNFIGSSPVFEPDAIRQEVKNLEAGQTYLLTFYWAAAEQFAFDGESTAGWTVTIGDDTFTTATAMVPNHGFVPWRKETFEFTSLGKKAFLSFQAFGGPSFNEAPFALLDGVSLIEKPAALGVPEPAAWALLILGFGGTGAAVRRRRASGNAF